MKSKMNQLREIFTALHNSSDEPDWEAVYDHILSALFKGDEEGLLTPEEINEAHVQGVYECMNLHKHKGSTPRIEGRKAIAKAQAALSIRLERAKVAEWGDKPCIEHSKVEWPAEMGGGITNRQRIKRRRCQHCWQALKEKVDEH